MIYLLLKGGLGNQLFQLGAALRASKYNVNNIKLIVQENSNFEFKLHYLFLHDSLPDLININEFNSIINSNNSIYKVSDTNSPICDSIILDHLLIDKNYFLDGYFQSCASALSVRNFFFEFSNPDLNELNCTTSACMHHRYGDYTRLDVQEELGLIDLSYYDRCFNEEYLDNNTFNVFSDSEYIKNYAESNDRIKNIAIGGNDIECFNHLRNSEILVIPNSTYSLMAAFLSKKIKLLVRPSLWSRKWVVDELTCDTPFPVKHIYNSFIKS